LGIWGLTVVNEVMREYWHRVINAEPHLRTESEEYANVLDMLDRKRSHLLESYKLANRS
jgi:hypothetical protein